MEKERIVIDEVLDTLNIRDNVGNVFVEKTDSPWNEKVLVKRKKEHLDTKITVWKDNFCLYGRIYRLLLYIHDILDRRFAYDSRRAPGEEGEPALRELYSQLWGIYVDSRVERAGIPNFYDRTLRRNLFLDARKDLTWEEGFQVFDRLWEKTAYTHPEIVGYANNLNTMLKPGRVPAAVDAFEVEMQELLRDHSVFKHIERLPSEKLRQMLNEILSFTAYNCKGTIIYSSYFGICIDHERRTFGEIITTKQNTIFLTLMNFLNGRQETLEVTESSRLGDIQKEIKKTFSEITRFQQQGLG